MRSICHAELATDVAAREEEEGGGGGGGRRREKEAGQHVLIYNASCIAD